MTSEILREVMAFERMSSIYLILIIKTVLLCNLVCANSPTVHKRFEYKYSFKPPYLAQKDGTVPFWEYGGSKYFVFFTVFIFDSSVRLTAVDN